MPSFAMGRELAGLGGLFNRFVAAPLTGAALFNQGRSGSVLNQGLQSIPSTRKTDAGRALGNVLGNEMRYMGSQLQRGSLPYLGNEMRYTTNELSQGRNPYGRPLSGLSNLPANYRGDELQLAARARADQILRGGSGAGGSVGGGNMGGYVPLATSRQAPADRAYQQELSRTAQLTAQDPELQRYENARVAAKTQEEMNSVRDMGMEMWAKANPKLAAKVQPGQSGFDIIYKQTGQVPTPTFNPLMERTFPGMSRGAGEYTMGPSPLVPQIDPALNPAGPTYALGEGPRLMNFSDEKVTPEMIKAYQEQLLKQAGAK
jgi:hypothetical protein